MSETTAMVLVALITALGGIATVLLARLTRKGLTYLDAKTTWMDAATMEARKEAIKNRIVEVVTLAARATTQTFVGGLKAASEDGKLTKAEAAEAFKMTMRESLRVLASESIPANQETLTMITEAVVGKLTAEEAAAKNAAGDATPATPE